MPPKKPKYQKLDQIDHMHKRPDMYIGSVKVRVYNNEYVFDIAKKKIIQKETIKYSEGLLRIFVEALSNAIDNVWRSREAKVECNKIKVDIDPETFETTIYNDGLTIPIEKNEESGLYNPELIMGNLLTSSNYDDDEERFTSGRNGLGIKLTNVFSIKFSVKTFDENSGKLYKKEWTENMRKSTPEKITSPKSMKNGFTEVSWIPDFKKFGMKGYDKSILSVFYRYVYDAAMVTRIPVYLNGEKVPIKNLIDYSKFYENSSGEYVSMNFKECNVVVTPSSGNFEHVAFTNGVFNREGGTHVDSWSESLFRPLLAKLNKPKKPQINIKDVKKFFRIFVNCTVANPEFTSQSKTFLSAPQITAKVPQKSITSIMKWSVISDINDIIKGKELLNLKKTEKKSKVFKKIPGFDPANNAGGKHSSECTLILCEGLSAKTYAVVGIQVGVDGKSGRDWFGIYPLRGKLLNVRNASMSAISKNKEITDVVNALGLQYGVDYETESNFNRLNYGQVMIMTDADNDGIHISSLIINVFHHLFPSLMKRDDPFITSMQTPIVKIGKNLVFYRDEMFKKYLRENPDKIGTIKYYKGLGTSSDKEVKDTFGKRVISYLYDDDTDDTVDKVFNSKRSDERKKWLEEYDPSHGELDNDYDAMDISDYMNIDHIKFSIDDCGRSIPHVFDGLKESQRKILYATFLKNLKHSGKSMKVAQLAGFVAEKSNYHHGEICLFDTITKMAQEFPGSNNIPYFYRDGQFGSRLNGGKDAANARYIFTKLEALTRLIFPKEDDVLLDRIIDDGDYVEPEYYVPILPMILVNGCSAGIGTGWSCSIPSFNPEDIIKNIKHWIKKGVDGMNELTPWYRGFDGSITKVTETKYETSGNFEHSMKRNQEICTITELPINTWTDKYKEFLEDLLETKTIKNLQNYSTPHEVKLVITQSDDGIICNNDNLKLKSYVYTSNMVLFTENNKIKKFNSINDIIDYFCQKRLSLYVKRRERQLNDLEHHLKILKNKIRFLEEIISEELEIFKKDERDIDIMLTEGNYDRINDTYDYLLNMNIRSFSNDKVTQLNTEKENTEKEKERITALSPEDMWITDLNEFQKEYKKWVKIINKKK